MDEILLVPLALIDLVPNELTWVGLFLAGLVLATAAKVLFRTLDNLAGERLLVAIFVYPVLVFIMLLVVALVLTFGGLLLSSLVVQNPDDALSNTVILSILTLSLLHVSFLVIPILVLIKRGLSNPEPSDASEVIEEAHDSERQT